MDNLRSVSKNAKQFLANLERSEQEKTGIKNLKIGYNRVFGYYIEISKANAAQAPENYIRKQTLSTGERYFTPELKDYESTILNARERIEELETELFRRVCKQIADQPHPRFDSWRNASSTSICTPRWRKSPCVTITNAPL